jgi:hypothetical protein
MATFTPTTNVANEALLRAAQSALLPVTGDSGATSLAASARFGPFVAGDPVIVCADAAFHMVAGTVAINATTSSPKFPAGMYSMTVPDGCTHVAMITAGGACVGQAYRG